MEKVPYDVLDDSITNTILTRDEVIRRQNMNYTFFKKELASIFDFYVHSKQMIRTSAEHIQEKSLLI